MHRSASALLLAFALVSGGSARARELSYQDVEDMTYAAGFCLGQTITLDDISRGHPTLSGSVALVKLEFQRAFGGAMEELETRLSKLDAERWEQAKLEMARMVRSGSDFQNTTEKQAIDFIRMVGERAKGELEDRVLQTLVLWHPEYRKQPNLEFLKYRRKLVSTGDAKAKGIRFQIEYPASWVSLEAERPNIVRKFVSERGRGLDFATISVKALPVGEKLSTEDVRELFASEQGFRGLTPPGADFVAGEQISFDGLPGGMIHYRMAVDRFGQQARMRILMYMTFHREKLIVLLFATEDDEATYARFEPLFQLMANSVVILSRYD